MSIKTNINTILIKKGGIWKEISTLNIDPGILEDLHDNNTLTISNLISRLADMANYAAIFNEFAANRYCEQIDKICKITKA